MNAKLHQDSPPWEALVVGGGMAGLSAAIYIARAQRKVLVVDAGHSLALWEPDVQNYLGFPDGIHGEELLRRGREQAKRWGVSFEDDDVLVTRREAELFVVEGRKATHRAKRLLLATGLLHVPPAMPCVKECLGHSMFFCKDCDGVKVQNKPLAVVGHTNDAVEYALGLLQYSACVVLLTDAHEPEWDADHARWLAEYEISFFKEDVVDVQHKDGMMSALVLEDGRRVVVESLFTVRGDVFHNKLARDLGAELDAEGQVNADHCGRTNIPGLYAAGCLTPTNCQMIVAAGQGASAGQAINRSLFEESLETHSLRRIRAQQLATCNTDPAVIE